MKFSANLGFLWTDRPLPDAIRAAKAAGFDAVECHWPYDVPSADVIAALNGTGLQMLGLNTDRGDVAAGENGLLALPGREADAKAAIDQAVSYAGATGTGSVQLMAGKADGDDAHRTFLRNLKYAVETAPTGLTLLIEPLNAVDAPGYFLENTDQAAQIIAEIGAPNLKLMFDCYHVARTEGDVLGKLAEHIGIIGHIQFAGVPDRGRPDEGALDYAPIFDAIRHMGWEIPLGAEYKPGGDTDATLGWMAAYAE